MLNSLKQPFRFLWLLFLFLGGCASNKYPIPYVTQSTYAPDTNAIVIVRTYTSHNKQASLVKTVWARFDPEYQTTSKKAYTFSPQSRGGFAKYIPGYRQIGETLNFASDASYEVYQLPPGRYILDWFSATVAGTKYQTPEDDGWNMKKGDAKWASFEVDPGDFVYLGDIRFYFSRSDSGMDVLNERDDVEEFLKKNYPWMRSGFEFKEVVVTWDKQYHSALGPMEPKEGVASWDKKLHSALGSTETKAK